MMKNISGKIKNAWIGLSPINMDNIKNVPKHPTFRWRGEAVDGVSLILMASSNAESLNVGCWTAEWLAHHIWISGGLTGHPLYPSPGQSVLKYSNDTMWGMNIHNLMWPTVLLIVWFIVASSRSLHLTKLWTPKKKTLDWAVLFDSIVGPLWLQLESVSTSQCFLQNACNGVSMTLHKTSNLYLQHKA